MSSEHPIKDGETLRKRIEAMPEDSVLFRSDSLEYRSEFVGETLTELTSEKFMKKDVLKLAGFFSSLSLLPQCCFYAPPPKKKLHG